MFQDWYQGALQNDSFEMFPDLLYLTNNQDFEDCLQNLQQNQPTKTQIQAQLPNLTQQSSNSNYSNEETNFEDEINVILINEGGYSNRKDDRGGETKCGITQKTYTNLQKIYPDKLIYKSVRDLEPNEVKEFYKIYLIDCKANQITNKSNRIQFADAAVHHGGRTATILVQRALGLKVDGGFGPNTRNSINNANELQFKMKFIQERRDLCAQLILKKPDQKANEKGWNNRFKKMENL